MIKELIDFRKYEAYSIICCGDYSNAEKQLPELKKLACSNLKFVDKTFFIFLQFLENLLIYKKREK